MIQGAPSEARMIRIRGTSLPRLRAVGRWGALVVAVGVLVAGSAGLAPAASRAVLVVDVRLGGLCPHDTVPPSPECAPRPLAGARLRLLDTGGNIVAAGKSGGDGRLVLAAPAGRYLLVPKPVQRARVTPKPQYVTLTIGAVRHVLLTYGTGIQ